MDFNQIPFKLRFNKTFKLFNEVNEYMNELDRIVKKRLHHIQVKKTIQQISGKII